MGNPEGMEGTFSEGLVSAFALWARISFCNYSPISHGTTAARCLHLRRSHWSFNRNARSGQNLNFAVPQPRLQLFSIWRGDQAGSKLLRPRVVATKPRSLSRKSTNSSTAPALRVVVPLACVLLACFFSLQHVALLLPVGLQVSIGLN